ncbi:MAG: ATP-binding protein [Catonella sp.]|nr:ATP-binding protein [Catonella sp.]MDY6356666.1 ATP-binding protein [Catonella sp.]
MIQRKIENELKELINEVPVLTITGPRQAGKTTLARALFPEYTYVNLEDQKTRELAINDYEGFFAKYKEPMIIDEVQRVPELLSAIQIRVDENRDINGRFVLTGSHQPKLREGIAQSLAGRTSIVTLLPLSIEEISDSDTTIPDINHLILYGFMPEMYKEGQKRRPYIYYKDYLETYIEKDLRQMKNIKDLDKFIRFLTLLAGRVGQVVNLSSMSGEIGVSSATLSEWLSLLIASNVVFELKPYFSNISKRIVKNSKLYFTEIGLASYLLGLEEEDQVDRDPLRGQLFENLVVVEALKARLNRNKKPNLYYVRTEKGVEVDLIFKSVRNLIPFEIKSAMTPTVGFSKNLDAFCDAEPTAGDKSVIYTGEEYPSYKGTRYINYSNISKFV